MNNFIYRYYLYISIAGFEECVQPCKTLNEGIKVYNKYVEKRNNYTRHRYIVRLYNIDIDADVRKYDSKYDKIT